LARRYARPIQRQRHISLGTKYRFFYKHSLSIHSITASNVPPQRRPAPTSDGIHCQCILPRVCFSSHCLEAQTAIFRFYLQRHFHLIFIWDSGVPRKYSGNIRTSQSPSRLFLFCALYFRGRLHWGRPNGRSTPQITLRL
jgi:hypothetical protein